MHNATRILLTILVFVSFLMGSQRVFAADKQLLVKITPFAVTPGESIVGVEFTVTGGKITHATRPRGWSCRTTSNERDKQIYFDCSSTHSTYGLTNAAKLPVMSIEDTSGSCRIEAQVKFESGSGQRDSKKLTESELSITR